MQIIYVYDKTKLNIYIYIYIYIWIINVRVIYKFVKLKTYACIFLCIIRTKTYLDL
ncbi:MAG: hypothetical protein MCS20_01020 [Candidatus Phytoplasma mali]|nr:hypothetical protein [Candidatus Phytoplasma australiense]MCG7201982.1 hypothetical protein [Candidatus Phytoplasma mali]MCZ8631918.1 hypothetical protein [Spiroplasma sp. Tabriz.8]